MWAVGRRFVNLFITLEGGHTGRNQNTAEEKSLYRHESDSATASGNDDDYLITLSDDADARALSELQKKLATKTAFSSELIAALYRLYRQHVCSRVWRRIDRPDERERVVAGLEYLYDENEDIERPRLALFSDIFLETLLKEVAFNQGVADHVFAVRNSCDAFLVSARDDFIYTTVLEAALLFSERPQRHGLSTSWDEDEDVLLTGEIDESQLCALQEASREAHRGRRATPLCCHELETQCDHATESGRHCPCGWLVYTKINSPFYCYFMETLSRESLFDFGNCHMWESVAERVSFFTVLLLCGHSPGFRQSNEASTAQINEMAERRKRHQENAIPFERKHYLDLEGEVSPLAKSLVPRRLYKETNMWVKLPLWTWTLWLSSPVCHEV